MQSELPDMETTGFARLEEAGHPWINELDDWTWDGCRQTPKVILGRRHGKSLLFDVAIWGSRSEGEHPGRPI